MLLKVFVLPALPILQGYGLLLTGAMLASLDPDDADRPKIMDYTYEMLA